MLVAFERRLFNSVFAGRYSRNFFKKLDFYNHPEKVTDAAKKSGVTISSFHAPFSCEISFSHPDEKQRRIAVETICRAISSAAEAGIKIMVLHPSGGHYEAYPNLKVCFDTNHCTHILPEDYLDELLASGMQGRIAAVHISDYDLCEEKHRLPGDGKINWERVLSKLEELDFDGVFMYEVSKATDREIPYTPQMVADNFRKIIPVGASIAPP